MGRRVEWLERSPERSRGTKPRANIIERMRNPEKFYLYIARCQDNSLYIGSTELSPTERIKRHNNGTGARWLKQHGPGVIVYTEEFPTLIEARRREAQIKRWSRKKKERLIRGLKP